MHDYAGQVLTSVLLWAGRTVLQEKCCKAPPKTLPDHTVVILNGTALCGKSTIALSLLKTTPGAKLLSEHHQYIGDSTVPAQRASTAEARQVVAQHARSFSTKGFPVVIDHSDPNHIVALQLAAAHVPEQGGRVLSVLVHAPLQELPARAHAVRSHRQGVDLPPSKAGWHPHGACPASSVWLPYVQYGAFYKGVPQGSPGGLEVLSRSSVSGVLDSAAAQALREGRRAADVAWEQGLVKAYLHRALGLEHHEQVHIVPRGHYDVVLRAAPAPRRLEDLWGKGKDQTPAAKAQRVTEIAHLNPYAAPTVPSRGHQGGTCERCLAHASYALCEACLGPGGPASPVSTMKDLHSTVHPKCVVSEVL